MIVHIPSQQETSYYIKQGQYYWLQSGRGYTTKEKEAGRLTLREMVENGFDLDRCTLEKAFN